MLLALTCLPLLITASASAWQQGSNPAAGPRLILLLVVDQGRQDYFERLQPVFSAGLKQLLEGSVQFRDAHQDHAITNTGPGHVTLSSGRFPGRTGIISNEWFDRSKKERLYCVGDESSPIIPYSGQARSSGGRSPANLRVTALPDWIKQHSPQSKAFTASLKDRSAILLGGKTADTAYWLESRSAQFVTSRYYRGSYPEWVESFRQRKIPESYFGKTWDALPGSARHHHLLDTRLLDHGVFAHGFPHFFGALTLEPDSNFYSSFLNSPFVDSYLVEFAKALIENEELGSDDAVDYLGLSFSALDLVGHDFGPNSPEVLDTLLRLDRSLGDLLDFVDKRIGLDRVAIVFSSDHGVVPLPEYRRTIGSAGTRSGLDEAVCFQQAGRRLEERFGAGPWFDANGYLDYQTLGRRNLRRQDVEEALAGWIEKCPSVERVWTRSRLEKPPSSDDQDPFLELYRHSFDPDRSPDLFVQFKQYHLNQFGPGTGHGTPYPYDSHVPLLFLLPGAKAKTVEERVRTVDVAPTLAAWLGIPAPADLDGSDLSGYIF